MLVSSSQIRRGGREASASALGFGFVAVDRHFGSLEESERLRVGIRHLLCSASSNAGAASPSVSLSFFHPSLIESPVVKQTSLAANLLELLILHSGENSVRTQISSLHNVESVNPLNEEDIPRFADSQGTEGGRQRRRLLASSSSACFFVADSQGREGGIGVGLGVWLRRRRPSLWQLGGVRETEGWDSS
nr:hypothetical protein Iba_chr03aCG1500 [Ipomoea batatas]